VTQSIDSLAMKRMHLPVSAMTSENVQPMVVSVVSKRNQLIVTAAKETKCLVERRLLAADLRVAQKSQMTSRREII
jgi:hypothetical protein